jgi:hypothetical protein
MQISTLRKSTEAFLKVARAFIRASATLFLWVFGLSVFVYVVRAPFYNDNIEQFLRYATFLVAGTIGFSVLCVIGLWLFDKSRIFRWVVLVIIALSILATCSSPFRCIESRYITCD